MQTFKAKLANLTKQQKLLFVGAGVIVIAVMLLSIVLMNSNRKQGQEVAGQDHDETKAVAEAQSRDAQNQKDLAQWKAPKNADELAKAQALVGKVGPGSDSKFETSDECLSSLSRELYAQQIRTKRDDIPGFSPEEYKAKRAACYQNPQ